MSLLGLRNFLFWSFSERLMQQWILSFLNGAHPRFLQDPFVMLTSADSIPCMIYCIPHQGYIVFHYAGERFYTDFALVEYHEPIDTEIPESSRCCLKRHPPHPRHWFQTTSHHGPALSVRQDAGGEEISWQQRTRWVVIVPVEDTCVS